MLDCAGEHAGFEPNFHVYYSDRVAWLATADDLPKLGGETGLEPLADSANAQRLHIHTSEVVARAVPI